MAITDTFTDCTSYQLILLSLGTLTLLYAILRLTTTLYAITRPSRLHLFRPHSHPPWALITGSTDGIGLALSQELAAQGFNLILHGRNPTKLRHLTSLLSVSHPHLQTHTFIADASLPLSPSSTDSLLTLLKTHSIHLTLLINNVGGNSNIPGGPWTYFHSRTTADIDESLNINMGFATRLTHALLPVLLGSDNRDGCQRLVLNIGSLAALGAPKLNVYAGTKGFLLSFTRALHAEMGMLARDRGNRGDRKDRGDPGGSVKVQYVFVGSVQSAENKEPVSMFNPSARTWARAALRRVGGDEAVVTPWVGHAVQRLFLEGMPEEWREWVFVKGTRKVERGWGKEEGKGKGG
ncbi:hypothetical protein MMC10_007405 [Thelotrema lepadinum]|nr:hypothetical protein [Thelotrema lepadinum]